MNGFKFWNVFKFGFLSFFKFYVYLDILLKKDINNNKCDFFLLIFLIFVIIYFYYLYIMFYFLII